MNRIRIIFEGVNSSVRMMIDAESRIMNQDSYEDRMRRYEGPKGGPGMKEMLNPTAMVIWPPISNALTREKAKEISKSVFPFSGTF